MIGLQPFNEAVFDIETTGLLDKPDLKGHCIVVIDAEHGTVLKFRPEQYAEGCKFISQCNLKIAHNGIWYDSPAIEITAGISLEYDPQFRDTLVLARLLFPNIMDLDMRYGPEWGLPKKLYGSHTLKAWGYRLGNYKGGFGETNDWSTFSEEMLEYCVQDVQVTVDLWKKLKGRKQSERAVRLEHDIAWVMAKQERNGFVFDEKAAISLYSMLAAEKTQMELGLKERFGGWWKSKGVKTPSKTINYRDVHKASRVAGAPFTAIEWVEFNPGSRQHIIKVLKDRGWQPEVFSETGQPKIDDVILKKLPWEDAKPLARYFLLLKRIGQIADGGQGWLKQVKKGRDGIVRIHGRVNPNGAVTGRATHSNPNVAQVPSCGAEYGPQCRDLFTVPRGWVLMGSDASGLELRCLGHYLTRWDGGSYAHEVVNGDVHWVNTLAFGFVAAGTVRDHDNPAHDAARGNSKTTMYCNLYGGGDVAVGATVIPNATPEKQRRKGKQLKNNLAKNVPALKMLQDAVVKAADRGYIIGLDGRKIPIRSKHSALNALLQSSGALVCKYWVCEVERLARLQYGLKHGWDGDFALCAWVHDEVQIACRNQEIADLMGRISQEAMKNTEKYFDFKCPLDSEYKTATTWKGTH